MPHEVLEVLFGSLLGDGHAERRAGGKGTRFSFHQEGTHLAYARSLQQ
jgi:ubiquinol-cytochrome c reductase cytochrome b subunit